jgi:Zn-dependent M16 (insulinase) family peptidase
LDRIAAGEGEAVVAELNRLRDCLVVSNQPAAAVPVGFIQIAGPNALDESTQLVEKLGKVWTEFSQQCQSPAAIVGHKRLANGKRKMESAATCFPHPRVPFSIPKSLKTTNELALMIPLPGITSSYLLQMVPCDVLSVGGEHHEDFMPLQVLTSLLSRSEGPLYSEIRGRGLAYDAVLSTYLWAGMLVFEVFDAREPVCALERFWSIINQYAKASDKQWDFDDAESMSSSGSDSLLFRKHDFESAIASLIYRLYAEVSTPMGQASETLKASIRGFRSLTELRSVPSVSRVTAKDLQRVFRRYFMQFLDRNNRITLLLTPPSPPDSYQTVRLSAGDVDCSLQFTAIDSIEVFFRQFQ